MKAPRHILHAVLAACLVAGTARAADTIRITVPSAPGGASDQLAQALKSALADERGESAVQIANVPGAGGTAGLAQFVADASDGALLVTGLTMIDAVFIHRAPHPLDRLTPIARLSAEPFALVVAAGSPFRAVEDLRRAMAADASRISWAGGPVGGIEHVATALLAAALGQDPARLNFVPFLSAAEAAAALPDGQLSAAILPVGEVAAEVRAGRVRPLAVSSLNRMDGLDAPTLIERGVPLDLSNWRGVMARPGITPEERARLVARVSGLAESRIWREALEKRGWQDAYLASDSFGAFIRSEQARVKAALRSIGLPKRVPD